MESLIKHSGKYGSVGDGRKQMKLIAHVLRFFWMDKWRENRINGKFFLGKFSKRDGNWEFIVLTRD